MPRYNDNRRSNSRDNDRRPSRQQSRRQQSTAEYFPIFSIFSNENRDGSRSLQIKRYETNKSSVEDVLTREQWLYIAGRLYDGEVTLSGRLWESEADYADMTGNIRLTQTDDPKARYTIDELLEGFEEDKPTRKKAKSKPAPKKPEYSIPEEDEEEDYEEAESTEEYLPY